MNWNFRFAKDKKKQEDHYQYIKKRGDKWVILQKGTGKVLSHHDTREKAIASFKAMMVSKHGSVVEARDMTGPGGSCMDCGKHCKNKDECKSNQRDDKRNVVESNTADWRERYSDVNWDW